MKKLGCNVEVSFNENTFNMILGDESLATQNTLIWIPPSMTFYVPLLVFPGTDSLQIGS